MKEKRAVGLSLGGGQADSSPDGTRYSLTFKYPESCGGWAEKV